MESNWDKDYIYGQEVIDKLEEIDFYNTYLLEGVKGCVTQVKNEWIQQKYDIDFYLDIEYDGTYGIEQKSVRNIFNKIFIETVSCPKTGSKGWIYKSAADILIYFMTGKQGRQHAYFIDMKALQKWWSTVDQKMYFTFKCDTANKSEGKLVPTKHLLPFITKVVILQNYKVLRELQL